MSVKPIVIDTDPIIHEKSEEIDFIEDAEEIKTLVQDLFDTLYSSQNGVGISAIQIGQKKRVFVTDLSNGDPTAAKLPLVFINPEILNTSDELIEACEGCLSVPDKKISVIRPKEVTMRTYDATGKAYTLRFSGFLARVVQHEYDHLEGIIITDYEDEE